VIGALLYLAQCTRPDISIVVNFASRHQEEPKPGHIKAVNRILAYLKGKPDLVISYSSSSEEKYSANLL